MIAFLLNLFRIKAVEIEKWVIIDGAGKVIDPTCEGKSDAEWRLREYNPVCKAIRLTGTAKVRA